MSPRSIAMMFLISLAVCPFSLKVAWAGGPAEPRRFPMTLSGQ